MILACATTTCLVGSQCIVRKVQCIKAPCPRLAMCVPNNGTEFSIDGPQIIKNPCLLFNFYYFFEIVIFLVCEVAKCAYGPCLAVGINCTTAKDCYYIGQCVNQSANAANYDVCQNSTCSVGYECRSEVVQCFASPCLNIPRCIQTAKVVNDPCEILNCTSDQICEKAMVKCKKSSCPPVARCVSGSSPILLAKDDPLPTVELQTNRENIFL